MATNGSQAVFTLYCTIIIIQYVHFFVLQVDELCVALKEMAPNLDNLHLPIATNITLGYDLLLRLITNVHCSKYHR